MSTASPARRFSSRWVAAAGNAMLGRKRWLAALLLIVAPLLPAQTTVYWDTNGGTAGSSGSTTATGTWNASTTANWTTSATGTTATSTWNALGGGGNKIAVFSAGTNATGAYTVTVSGTVSNVAGLTFEEGHVTLTGGTLSLGATSTINVAASEASIASAIGGSFGITKTGNGTLYLSGNNSYTGATLINAGAINLQSNTALGTTAGNTTVANGAALELQGGITVTNEALILNGTGLSGTGALRNISGNNTWTGSISLATNSTITSDAGLLTLGGTIQRSGGTNRALTIDGNGNTTITGQIANTITSLTKTGGGTLTLTNTSNAYTGATNIGTAGGASGGTLRLGASNVLPNTAVNVYAGTLDLNGFSDTVGALSLGGGASGTSAHVTTGAGTLTLGGNLTYNAANNPLGATISGRLDLGAANRTFTIGDSSAADTDLTISAAISGARSITKAGNGTLVLSGDNTYTGTTTVNAGVLNVQSNTALGTTAGGTTVASGAALELQGGITVTNEALTLNGAGVGGHGALRSIDGNNTWTGALTLASATTIAADSGQLTLSGNLIGASGRNIVFAGDGDIMLLGALSNGTSTLTKLGEGTLTLGNSSNNYTGTTTIGSAGGSTGGTLRIGVAHGPSAAAVTLYAGTLDLNNFNQTIGALNLGGGASGTSADVTTGTGTLTLGGNLTYSAANNALGATISGRLDLGAANRTFTIGDSTAAANDLTISATISNPSGARSLTKAGNGTLVLSGNNTYSGGTTLSAGTLTANSNTALGTGALQLNAGTLDSTSGATLANTGTLGGNVTLRDITLSGALTQSGNRTLTLDNATLSGNVYLSNASGTARTLTAHVGTGTDATVSGSIANFNGAGTASHLTKTGAGTLVLSGTNTYTGTTTISGGTVQVTNNAALGSLSGGPVNISGGGTLDLGGFAATGANFGAKQFNISGTGVDGQGAIVNHSPHMHTSAFQRITLTGNATIGGTGRYDLRNSSPVLDLAGHTLTKVGTNQVSVVAGTITSGNIVVNEGMFAIQTSTNATGAGTITFNAGTTAGFWNNTGTVTRAMTFNGNTVLNESGTSTIGSAITLGGTTTMNVAGGTSLTFTGNIGQTGGAQGIDKVGTGVLVLSGTNSFAGPTTIGAGTLRLGSNGGLSSSTAVNVAAAGATFDVNGRTATIGSLSGVAGSSVTLGSGSLTTAGNSSTTFAGNITGTGSLVKAGTGTLTLSGSGSTYSGGTTVTAGTLQVANAGALGAATSNLAVHSGATLYVGDSVILNRTGTLTLNGSGATASSGALHGGATAGQTSQITGNLTLAGNATITAGAGLLRVGDDSDPNGNFNNAINLGSHTLTLHTAQAPTVTPIYTTYPSYGVDPSNLYLSGVITGTGGLAKTGAGVANLQFGVTANSYTGATTVTGGTLIVDGATSTNYLSGNSIVVGNASSPGTADSVVLQMGQLTSPAPNYMIGTFNDWNSTSSTTMTIYEDGRFNMNGGSTGLQQLVLRGGHADGGAPGYAPLLTVTGNIVTQASSQTARIDNGNLAMGANSFAYNVASGTTSSGIDLLVNSTVQNGIGYTHSSSAIGLTKTGAGTLVFGNANVYQGITDVQQGVLRITHGQALGQATFGSTTNGTTVASGAQLQLAGNITVANETLTLNGGLATGGALRNLSGNNTYGGSVRLASDSRINADAGTTLALTNPNGLSATILNGTGGTRHVTFGGNGDIAVNGGIASLIGNVTKDGSGTLTLAGSNSYTGATNVTAGAVRVTHNNGLYGSGVVVSNGASLQFAQTAGNANIVVNGTASTLHGHGLNGDGAIQNLSGDNSYLGNIALGSASRIAAANGTSLTLNGAITGSNALTVGSATHGGTLTFGGGTANSFSGGLNIHNGTLILNKSISNAAAGTGQITIGDGVGAAHSAALRLNQNQQISNTARVTVNTDGLFDVNSRTETIGSVQGAGTIALASGTLILNDSTSTTFAGAITGTSAALLQKNGSGTFTVSSNINFGGDLALSGGTLEFSGAAPIVAGNLTIGGGTTLKLTGSHLQVGSINITGNTVIDFGTGSASILQTGNLTISNGASVTIVNWTDTIDHFFAQIFNGSTINTRGQGTELNITFSGFNNSQTAWLDYTTPGYNEITPAPEPATYGAMLMGAAFAFLGYRRWRKPAAPRQ